MNKLKQEEKELKEFYKLCLAEYIAKAVEIKYRLYGKATVESYQHIYNTCQDTIVLNDVEKQEIYNMADDILTNKYDILIANEAFNEDVIHLVNIKEEV